MSIKLKGSKWTTAPSKFQKEEKKEVTTPFKIEASEEFEKRTDTNRKKIF
jgi:hypothetical protein